MVHTLGFGKNLIKTIFPDDNFSFSSPRCQRRVREVWDSKKELLRETGKQVVQQLAEATAAVAPSQELAESSVPAQAVSLCAMQVCSISPHSGLHVLRVLKRLLYFISNRACIHVGFKRCHQCKNDT